MGLEKSTKLFPSGITWYILASPPIKRLKTLILFERSHCPSVLYILLICTNAAPPVMGASGMEPDFMSQLLMLRITFFKESKRPVPGIALAASATVLAYWLAAARFE